MTDDLLWAYGVVAPGATLPPDLIGVAGSKVEPVAAGGLVALTGRVPRAEFGAEPLRDNLNDLAWLERVARDHEAVLEQVLAGAAIVPLRLCTIFDDAGGVEHMLARERDALARGLERLEGRQEWGVKVLVERGRLMEHAAPAADQAQVQGGAYLARRRQEREAREAARALAVQIVDDVDGSLRARAVDAVVLPAQNRELSGHEGDMVLNAAYLVDADRVGELQELVAGLRERHRELGAELVLTGPWPPYNFVAGETTAQPV